jgi:4-amino-4-deoxy-L-arabinose transferase-like glycosyltransferase
MAMGEPAPSEGFPSSRWPGQAAAVLLFLLTASLLLSTIKDYGVTWDEAETNFPAARNQTLWFRTFFSTGEGLNAEAIRQHFQTESDHPSLPRTAMALSRLALPISVPDRVAFAAPTAVLVSAFTAFFFLILLRRLGLTAAWGATLLLLFHPRWFADSHMAEYDIQIAMAWFLAAASFYWAMEEGAAPAKGSDWLRAGFAGICLGLAISVKLHAFFLPFPLVAWALTFRKWKVWKWMACCAVLAPLVYLATQPYLWWDTVPRLIHRFQDYGNKVPITVYYLGHDYQGNAPWHYPWVMLAATLPPGLAFFLAVRMAAALPKLGIQQTPDASRLRRVTFVLLNAVTIPLLFSWKSPYDGIRFFLPSLPFLAILAAEGIHSFERLLARRAGGWMAQLGGPLVTALLVLTQVSTCFRLHPDQLAYYSFIVGGTRGAHALGFETTYWCDAFTPDFLREFSGLLPENAKVASHAFDQPPLVEAQRAGLLPASWTFTKEGPVHARVLLFRQGFFGPAEWELAERHTPILERSVESVPLVRVYRGP